MPRASNNKNGANSAKDIRSYFAPIANSQKKNSELISKPQKRRVISSDEDEEKPKTTAKRSKILQKIKKTVILSDSEDDMINDSKQPEANKTNGNKESLKKIVSPSELFSKKPITRVEETKVNKKLQKMESEFHNDDDFDAVLNQLDECKNIQNIKKEKGSTKNANISNSHEAITKAEVSSNKSKKKKEKGSSEKSHNETNETNKIKDKEVKSSNKDNLSKTVTSSPKRKLQKRKKSNSSSNEDLDTNDKHTRNISKKFNFTNMLTISISASTTKDEDIGKRSSNKKKTKDTDLFEERIEKKRQQAILYEKYLQRGGARNPGSKTIPTGAKNCLAGLTFLTTGVFESLERNEVEDLIKNYGGRIVNSVSSKVNYIMVGDEAGPAKLAKANTLSIKQITEDDLLEMIRTRPEGKSEDIKPTKAKPNVKKMSSKSESDTSPSPNKTKALLVSPKKETSPISSLKIKMSPKSVEIKISLPEPKQTSDISSNLQEATTNVSSEPLVEKYRPKTLKQIIGQQGDRSSAHNLYVWLRDWHKNRQDPKSSSKQNNGQSFKAALLSGSPGVGKTTTAQIVCKELGYDLLEFNASDTRSKTLLKEQVSGLLSNTTMKDYCTGNKQKITSKHALLMDEVDGMAGNEDRGGLQELVNLIKHTDVPVICICNDRFNTKMRTLSCHTYDLKFPKLRVEQIRSSMKSLCFKENIQISTEDLDRLIESTNYDIRQVINHLEFLSGKTAHVEAADKKHSNKNFKLGPFDVAKLVFNAAEQRSMNLNDKIGLYFHDYNIAPLFVQENYPAVKLSQVSSLQRLEKIARAADSISQGDLIEKVMRSSMMWSLLPLHACFSFVIPGNEMSGNLDSMVRFPGWFGRNSKATRFNRLMQELTTHTRLATGANKDALNLDYMVHIRNAVVKPLLDNGADGIEAAIAVMGKYHLMREDLDSMMEISLWPGISDPTSNLDSKVKAAFTRAYQKNSPMLPYAINSAVTTKKRSAQDDDLMDEEEPEEEEDNIDSDKMVKVKKPTVASTSKAATIKKTDGPAKKRGRGRGKAK
ncbi:replication factor C subunit 1 [Harpegnathos saltator]|uniref:Replication factor C subunit 1 n=1 Tax=Harpegnathos saltator TaxID=610380 RepID=E2C0X4_HARSA|nr:replication factor C subunit 1 [Harpegnathos saltator]XP_025156254.1 replication factor C subunit 1 [Harpegnathos saltator]EFN78410.1 Replication factor C subunit 1 [Harpegnathos saltator]